MTDTPVADLSFEDALRELEQVVGQLEGAQVALEDSIQLYERGQALKAHCEEKLRVAEEKISLIDLGPDGSPQGAKPASGL